jgi:hypothetical protein
VGTTATVRPVSTPLPANPPVDDTAAITDRFSTAIWPAIVDYHYHPTQNGPAQLKYLTLIDPGLDQSDWGALRDAVQNIGEITPNSPTQNSAGVQGLQLGAAHVSDTTATTATVNACYTFTALTYTMESGFDPVRSPAAATADFALVYTDTWYLHSITNQHAVPGC